MAPIPIRARWQDRVKRRLRFTGKGSKVAENESVLSALALSSTAVEVSGSVTVAILSNADVNKHVRATELVNRSILVDSGQLRSASTDLPSTSAPPVTVQSVPEQLVPEQPISSASTPVVSSLALTIPIGSDLWAEALEILSASEQESLEKLRSSERRQLSSAQPPLTECMNDILKLTQEAKARCEEKSFKFHFNGRVIIARDVVGKIVFWLGKFKEVGDVAVNFDPIHAALPWAGVRFLLQAATAESAQMGDLLLAVEKVSCLISRGAIYQRLYKPGVDITDATENLHEAMVKMYALALRMIAESVGLFTKNTASRTLHAIFNPDAVSALLDESKNLEKQVEYAANNCERVRGSVADSEHKKLLECLREPMIRTDENVLSLLQKMEYNERLKVLEWISKVRYQTHHKTVQEKRTEGTCEWLLGHESYHEWKSESSSNILWLNGTAGTGKTYLTAAVIDDISQSITSAGRHQQEFDRQSQEGFAYFYCKRSEPERGQPLPVLKAFIRQLSTIAGDESFIQLDLLSYAKKTKMASGDLTMGESEELLLKLVNIYPKTSLVLDALDECDHDKRVELIRVFERILKDALNPVKIFISSRPDGDIKEKLKDRANIYINATDNDKDISRFVKSEIQQHRFWSTMGTELQTKIETTLQKQSQGMFQWAYLQIKQLLELHLPEDIEKRLGRLPQGLKTTYDEIVESILEHEREIAYRAVKWVMCARHPLTTEAILPAVRQDGKSNTLVPVGGLNEDLLLEYCHNLLVIDPERRVWVPSHLSVIEYFEEHKWNHSEANCLVTSVCLLALQETPFHDQGRIWQIWKRNLSFPDESQKEPINPEFPSFWHLSLYAMRHWPLHAQLVIGEAEIFKIESRLATFLGMPMDSSPAYRLWLDMLEEDSLYIDMTSQTSIFQRHYFKYRLLSADSMACFTFCLFALDLLLPNWYGLSWVNDRRLPENGVLLLELAAASGSVRTCRLICAHNENVNASNNYSYGRALAGAINTNSLDVVRYLVNGAGVDVNMQSQYNEIKNALVHPSQAEIEHGSALVLASVKGSENMLELLIKEMGAIVDMQVQHGSLGSALVAAIVYREIDALEYLVQKGGADVNLQVQGGDYGTPLIAASYGTINIVEWLVKQGAVVHTQAQNGNYGSALIAASSRRYRRDADQLNLTRYLVSHGADVNLQAKVGKFGNALIAAFYGGNLKTVQWLVKQGADINIQAKVGKFGNALIATLCSGNLEIVQWLVEQGVDINIQAKVGKFGNALIAASYGGNLRIVQWLVEQGADINIQAKVGNYGNTLIAASYSRNLKTVQWLVEQGVDINIQAKFGKFENALIAASYGGNLRIAQWLVEQGVDINIQATVGNYGSALIAAILSKRGRDFGSLDIVRLLVGVGADVNLQVKIGEYRNALASALATTSWEIIQFISEKMRMEEKNEDDDDDREARERGRERERETKEVEWETEQEQEQKGDAEEHGYKRVEGPTEVT